MASDFNTLTKPSTGFPDSPVSDFNVLTKPSAGSPDLPASLNMRDLFVMTDSKIHSKYR